MSLRGPIKSEENSDEDEVLRSQYDNYGANMGNKRKMDNRLR